MARGGIIQGHAAAGAGDTHPGIVDGRIQRLAEGYAEDARPGVVVDRDDCRRYPVCHCNGLVWSGRYAVAGDIEDGARLDVQLRLVHRVDGLPLDIRERQGHRDVGVQYSGGYIIQGQAAGGPARIPDMHAVVVDGRAQRLAECYAEDAGARVIRGGYQGGRDAVGHVYGNGGLGDAVAGDIGDGALRDGDGGGVADGGPLGGIERGGDGIIGMALGGDVIQRDVAVLAGQYQPRVVDVGTQRLAEGYAEDAGAGDVGGRDDCRRYPVYYGDGLVGGGRYAVAGDIEDGVRPDVQLRGGHIADHLALGIRECQGCRGVGVQYPGGYIIQGQAADGPADIPDMHAVVVDCPVERLAEGDVQDAGARIVVG